MKRTKELLLSEKKLHQADIGDIQGRLTQALSDKEYAKTHQKIVSHNVEIQVPYEKCYHCDKTVLEKSKADYDRAWKHLNGEFKAKTMAFEGVFAGFVAYALLITVFMAIRTQSFVNDVVIFFQAIWEGILDVLNGILYIGKQVATLSERISNTTASAVLHWVLLIGMIVILVSGIIAVVWFAVKWISSIYKKYCWDEISVMVAIISVALVIFFGDRMKQFLSINQVVLLILLQGIYTIIRWYVQGCMENRGYYNQ
ncbi:MAG TPA: DUF6040 family protein [Lachnospiraceae bacterium]|nr:DUF6040 family protein [Lachnospiraceae bacterium]